MAHPSGETVRMAAVERRPALAGAIRPGGWVARLTAIATAERALLVAMLLIAAVLRLAALDQQGYGNTYYAAAVQSMLTGWHAFFFGSFDPGGFVTVDKPPLGLWAQALSATIFGFSGFSLFLPQIVAGVLSVALTYAMVRQVFGTAAGLLAGIMLALTPVAVVVDRNNSQDSLVVLAMLAALWAGMRAADEGKLRWLLVAAICIGLGFNVKMLQAYLVLPAVYGVYLLTAARPWRTRFVHLALATLVLLAVSLSWSALVDLTPAAARPFVGSSGTNSALSLALGYNGLGRMAKSVGAELGTVDILGLQLDLAEAPGFDPFMGEPGVLRLFNVGLAGQIAWLIPLAVIGIGVAAWPVLRALPRLSARQFLPVSATPRTRALLGWGMWWLTLAAFYSTADFFHSYYLATLAPATAALAAIAVASLWPGAAGERRRAIWLAPAIVATAAMQSRILDAYPTWQSWIAPLLGGGCLLAIFAVVLGGERWAPRRIIFGGALATLLIAPAAWSVVSVAIGAGGGWIPRAGPPPVISAEQIVFPASLALPENVDFAGFTPTLAGPHWNVIDPALVDYLLAHAGSARYLAATDSASFASVFMLATDRPALALGGYQGWDEVVSPAGLAAMLAAGDVRFFWVDPALARGKGVNADLIAWVADACSPLEPSAWGAPPASAAAGDGDQDMMPDGGVFPPFGGTFPPLGQGMRFDQKLVLFDCAAASAH